jgi:Zn-dependent protease
MILSLLYWIVVILISASIHELAHGLVAYLRGDRTAYWAGRLTLNPLKHIDPFWTVLLPAVLFFSTGGRFAIGMAKPVPVNPLNLKSPRTDMMLVALAGPAANLLVAALITPVYYLLPDASLLYLIYFNIALAVFNLIPIPPLDGSRLVSGLLPRRLAEGYDRLEGIGFFLILILYFLGILWLWVVPGINLFTRLLGLPRLGLFG